MKFSLPLAALAATLTTALPSNINTNTNTNMAKRIANSSVARLLIGYPAHIMIADYDGSKFTTTLNETVSGSPSWMAFAEPNLLYAVDENSYALRLFKLDLKTNKLELAVEKNASYGVVHLEFNKDKTRLVGSAYGNATVDVWNIENGGLELVKTITQEGQLGPGQTASHPHQANLEPSGRFFAVNDLGFDSITLYDSKDDAFNSVSLVQTAAGCGPRHGVWYPHGADKATHYLVACEVSSEVYLYSVKYTDESIAFTEVQNISTYGEAFPPANTTSAAVGEIILAPNNKDLYISNRVTGNTTDSIAHFIVESKHCGAVSLKFADTVATGGIGPRMISLGANDSVVFAGNQKGELGLVALKRDEDGKLEETPTASLPGSLFGADGFAPQFVLQIA
ncbi:hypothetical protein G7046_g8286 [Stylonectria norvegica]|nr:hypothetical protein G7046_g8286 [Stylonectria norvegica]